MTEPDIQAHDRHDGSGALLLASASPRRRELLAILVEDFDVRPAGIDEQQKDGEPPEAYVERMALEKAGEVGGVSPLDWVIGSDTAVVCGDVCLGKPSDHAQAGEMLRSLSGRSHRVLSSVALIGPDSFTKTAVSVSEVRFENLPDEWIRRYVATGEPMDKAGGYAIQGSAAAWISRLEGSYSGVVGLPLFETATLLRGAGLLKD